MPIYEYRCRNCNSLFEIIVSAPEIPDGVSCTKCGGQKTEKTISAGSYRLTSGGSGSRIPAGALSGCTSKSGFS